MQTPRESCCIYCLSPDGPFTAPEHVFPESLGNREVVLPPGIVCDPCNHGVLSTLDEALVNHPHFKFLRPYYVPRTKAGKLPRSHFRNARLERQADGVVRIVPKDRSAAPKNITRLPDGRLRLTIQLSAAAVNPMPLARAIYKVGIGVVAFQDGAASVLRPRLDPARNFIRGIAPFPNVLLLNPGPSTSTITVEDFPDAPGTVLRISIWGVVFCLNLEVEPILDLDLGLIDNEGERIVLDDPKWQTF